jgi:hypothetical protein
MSESFVFMAYEKDRDQYSCWVRDSYESYLEDKRLIAELGYTQIRLFRVPKEVGMDAFSLCTEFMEDNISLEDLEAKVDLLKE